jgi:hypothetical protein
MARARLLQRRIDPPILGDDSTSVIVYVCLFALTVAVYRARYVQIKLFPAVSGSSYSPPTLFRVHKNDLACFTGVLG